MGAREHLWIHVMAGGDGRRLSPLVARSGTPVPKQYCTMMGGRSLIHRAYARARRLAPAQRVMFTVSRRHQAWWEKELRRVPSHNLLIEPSGRGTAPAVLWAALDIANRDPEATIVLVPADHQVRDEATLAQTMRSAAAVARREQTIVLLGAIPEGADPSLGWILPAHAPGTGGARVSAFVEKPTATQAAKLLKDGARCNTLLCAAPASVWLELYALALPGLLDHLRAALSHRAGLDAVYDRLAPSDLCSDGFAKSPELLRLIDLPACGWCDVGTLEHLARCLQGYPDSAARKRAPRLEVDAAPDLGWALQAQRTR